MTEHINEPAIGSTWKHKNGNQYTVEAIANGDSERQDEYPTTVVYRGTNGLLWGRPLTRWHASMALSQQAPAKALTDLEIREIMIAHGFKIQEGLTDLKPYVYAAARALLAAQSAAGTTAKPMSDEEADALLIRMNKHMSSWESSKNRSTAEISGEALRFILAAQPAASVPPGWKLVPIEPTEAMIQQACLSQCMEKYSSYEEWWDSHSSGISEKIRGYLVNEYRIMIAAAPDSEKP